MRRWVGALSVAVVAAVAGVMAQTPAASRGVRVEISFPASVHSGPVTGRVYVMLSRTNDREPRLQIGRTGTPFFGREVEKLAPGQSAIIDVTDLGTPVASLRDLPPGDYYVQGFVNIYSEFKRADGHVVWMHDDQWEGQRWNISPGNLYSDPQRVRIDATTETIKLSATNKIPAVVVPADTPWVKRFKIQSPLLTRFWGRPIYLGATVLLPRDYETATVRYPVLYRQGHFGLGAPLGFQDGSEIAAAWARDDFPRMLVVTLQHPSPYFDDSYGVNSVNLGPYGDALIQELIPEVEKRYRAIGQPWARITDGGSTGGWISLAHQIFYPDFYGGVWSYCPDSVTFTDVEGINVYKDDNAFYRKVHVYAGTRDNFFLYGDGKGHCWQGPETTAERLKQMAAHMMSRKPDGMTTPWWRY